MVAVCRASTVITTASNSHSNLYVRSDPGKAAKCSMTQVALSVTIHARRARALTCATDVADGEAKRPFSLSLASPTNTLMYAR